MLSGFIRVVILHFFLRLNNKFIIWMYYFYPFISWWTFGFFLSFGDYEQSCCEHCWTGYLVESLLSHLLEFLDHVVILCLTFWGTTRLFSVAAAPFYIPASNAQGSQFLHILVNTCYSLVFFFIIAILMGMKWYLMVLVFISLIS